MNTVVLIPGRKSLRYAGFVDSGETCTGTIRGFRWQGPRAALDEVRTIVQAMGLLDDVPSVVVHGLFGGEEFPGPANLDQDALSRLERVARQSPLHVAGLIETARAVEQVFAGAPARLAFETSFFVDLPLRERTYAVSPDLSHKLALRRWGYHGLFHEAAAREAGRRLRKRGLDCQPRILSICLDTQPEIAAVLGCRPITVTSGATPLEGLPGETNSGEIDPAVALALAGEAGPRARRGQRASGGRERAVGPGGSPRALGRRAHQHAQRLCACARGASLSHAAGLGRGRGSLGRGGRGGVLGSLRLVLGGGGARCAAAPGARGRAGPAGRTMDDLRQAAGRGLGRNRELA